MKSFLKLIGILFFLLIAFSGFSQQISKNPLIDSIINCEKEEVIKRADALINEKPVTVTASVCSRSAGSVHDYYSEGTYWWPDPENPDGPYIRKDGMNNPENFVSHIIAIERFGWISGSLTSAYLLTGNEKYAKAAVEHLRAWFVVSTTRMNPNLLYSQAIKGICTGRKTGIIDAIHLIEVAQSVKILQNSPYLSGEDLDKIKIWFETFLTFLTTHEYGIGEMNADQNHGTWWLAQTVAFASLVENQKIIDFCKKRYLEVVLPNQMAQNGSFPLELSRTKPYGYSLFNLDGFAALTWMLSDQNFDVWNTTLKDGRGMKKAIDFMIPFIKDKKTWTYPKDVLHWDEQPNRQPFLIFAAMAQQDMDLFKLWKSIKLEFKSDESRRNMALKNPLLWVNLPNPIADKIYTNPIIPGFNPDPSICRVGDDYYLVTSTFEYFPGVPIYHSKDLVHWKMISHVLNRPSQLNLDSANCSGGIYAPTIRYNKGTYYMITTLVGTSKKNQPKGNFIVTAKKPEGPWSDPHWIDGAVGIDPSLFFDDDGKVYYSGNCSPAVKLFDKHRNIWIQELDVKTWKLVGKKVDVLDGGEYFQSGTLGSVNNYEASHVYKKDGKYYVLIAHGGTSQNHSVSIWVSDNIFGPYKVNTANPILTHRDLSKEHAFTSTGHADLVQTQDGNWWAVYLAKRPYGGENHILGRETFMSPVDWSGKWPVVNPKGNKGRGEIIHRKPNLKEFSIKNTGSKDEFDGKNLQNQWTFIRTPRSQWWSLNERKGFLRLQLRSEMISQQVNPSFVGKRQEHKDFTAIVKMDFSPKTDKEEAGLVVERDKDYHFKFTIGLENGKQIIKLVKRSGVDAKDSIISKLVLAEKVNYLKITSNGVLYNFSYSSNEKDWKILQEKVDGRFLGLAGAGRFTGTFIGMYGSSNGSASKNYVDFDWFDYLGNQGR